MKTAMQELIENLKSKGGGMEIYLNANTEIINEALEKEKEQIINAYVEGGEDILLDRSENNIDFFGNCHKYYNKIYK